MADSIEKFVDRLQRDGVEVGRQEADRIRGEAQRQAQDLIRDAEQRVAALIRDAEAECSRMRERTETELQLAVRDAVRRLQQTLSNILQSALANGVEEQLSDPDFLQRLLSDVVDQFVQADFKGADTITINVSEPMQRQLVQRGIQELCRNAESSGKTVDLRGTLVNAGFEYKVNNGTVEVTAESIVEVLGDLVGPVLRETLSTTNTSLRET